MQKQISFYIFVILLFVGFFVVLFPYPTFYSGSYQISKNDLSKILQYNEIEQENSTFSPSLGKLNWQECVANLMENGASLNLVLLSSGQEVKICRTGGQNHANIVAFDDNSLQILSSLTDKEPCLIELHDGVYSACSLYKNRQSPSGHFCLYFVGSKTDGMEIEDSTHYKVIDKAYKLGQKFLKSIYDM